MPLFSFFEYSHVYTQRNLNSIEMKLFRVCRNARTQQGPIVVQNIKEFLLNLNNRFCFSHIKKWINFSLFLMAGEF
jgi:hypothetical protein